MRRVASIAMLAFAPALWMPAADARQGNHLAGSASPYLLQHTDNPVDWYPWGDIALAKAQSENKPIMISVGYASCHWCHVMERESFMDAEIASLLNSAFVSIKIDRESRPDLDARFMITTGLMTGGGGWPNTVFLTPEGAPIAATSYLPPADFGRLIAAVAKSWRNDPHGVALRAAEVAWDVDRTLARRAEAREITPATVTGLAAGMMEKLDPFNGGYGHAPKFPRETLFLFLLDHAERTGNRAALAAVTEMLDGMIRGGIHDHVGGGFHRYAVDPEWHVPHFEKMLYTQALTGRLLVRAWTVTGTARYRRAAERLFDYVLRTLRDPAGGFYAAEDANSPGADGEEGEGPFYIWTTEQLARLGNDAAFAAEIFGVTEDGELDGANVLHLVESPQDLEALHGLDAEAFAARLDSVLGAMQRLRQTRPAPRLDRKIIVSWNAMMIQTLAEAGYRLDRPDYLAAAETAAEFLRGALLDGEDLKRVAFEGKTDIAGQLADYAGLGLAFIALHDFLPDPARRPHWLEEARKLAQAIPSRFEALDDGFAMTQAVAGGTRILPLDDIDTPSGNALALALFDRLARRTTAPEIEQRAYDLAGALSGHAVARPDPRGALLKAFQDLHWGERGRLRHAARGKVRVELRPVRGSGAVSVAISIADGWHINAHEPLEDYLIATEFAADGLDAASVRYPSPVVKALAFNDMELALLEGGIEIHARFQEPEPGAPPRRATLTLQACSNEICLAPETLAFTLW